MVRILYSTALAVYKDFRGTDGFAKKICQMCKVSVQMFNKHSQLVLLSPVVAKEEGEKVWQHSQPEGAGADGGSRSGCSRSEFRFISTWICSGRVPSKTCWGHSCSTSQKEYCHWNVSKHTIHASYTEDDLRQDLCKDRLVYNRRQCGESCFWAILRL